MRPLPLTVEGAKDYYYEKDVVFGEHGNGLWRGTGSEYLGIEGELNQQQFDYMLQGCSPKYGKMLVQNGANAKHRAAIDIPFSAPKSVSIMALFCEDSKIIKAHQEAVKSTIEYIEKRYIHTRQTHNKETKMVKGGKAVFATFDHSTSRASDPHLHTHVLTMNMVKVSKGWKALCTDPIWKDQRLLTAAYNSFLKHNVEQLGYKTKDKKVGFEIEGVEEKWIELFSKRSKSIKEKQAFLAKHDPSLGYGELYRRGFLDTRDDKNHNITYKELKELWQTQLDKSELLKNVEKAKNEKDKFNVKILSNKEKLNLVTEILQEKESVFDRVYALKVIMKTLNINILEAERFFKKAIKYKQVVHLQTDESKEWPKQLYSTKEMIDIEKRIVEDFRVGRNNIKTFAKDSDLEILKEEYAWLTKGQKEAVEHILNTNDKFSIVQGDAGTGKTACIKAVKRILDDIQERRGRKISSHIFLQNDINVNIDLIKKIYKEHAIIGMGFTGKSAQELESESGIKSFTIDSFLNKAKSKDEIVELIKKQIKPIWIVDESSMIASKHMNKIVSKAKEENAKVVFVGDGKQFASIGAGKMFTELQKIEAVKTIKMSEVMRQKTTEMRQTVSLIKGHLKDKDGEGKFLTEALTKLKETNHVFESKTDDISKNVAKDYVTSFGKKDTLIVCPDNELKDDINSKVRELLKKELKIGTDNFTINCKTPVNLSGDKKYFSYNYKKDQKAFLTASIEELKRGERVSIKSIDKSSNEINFVTIKNKTIKIDPLKQVGNRVNISLFSEKRKKFSVGEKIVFQKNDKMLGVQNGLSGKINSLNKKGDITVKLSNEKVLSFNTKQYSWLDHGYAVTTYKSQGQTCDRVMFATTCEKSFMNNSSSFYVAATRARNSMDIYTDNIEESSKYFARKYEKSSTLEYER